MKCTICGKEIEVHGIRFCRSCRKREHREKYNRNHDQKPKDGYHSLAVAIVRQACNEWAYIALKHYKQERRKK